MPAPIRERYAEDQFAFGYLPRPETWGPLYLRLPDRREPLTAEGRLSAPVPTEAGADVAFRYQLEADVEGVSGQHIANRAVTLVHPASFYIGLARPPFFVNADSGFTAGVVAVDLAGAARANVPVTVSLVREQWRSERRPENPGFPDVGADRDPVGRVDDHDDGRSRVAADPAARRRLLHASRDRDGTSAAARRAPRWSSTCSGAATRRGGRTAIASRSRPNG